MAIKTSSYLVISRLIFGQISILKSLLDFENLITLKNNYPDRVNFKRSMVLLQGPVLILSSPTEFKIRVVALGIFVGIILYYSLKPSYYQERTTPPAYSLLDPMIAYHRQRNIAMISALFPIVLGLYGSYKIPSTRGIYFY